MDNTLIGQLNNAQMALLKLENESFRTEANFQAEMVAVEESLDAKKARIKSLNRGLAAEVEKI